MTNHETKKCVRCSRWYPYKRILEKFWHEDESNSCVKSTQQKNVEIMN